MRILHYLVAAAFAVGCNSGLKVHTTGVDETGAEEPDQNSNEDPVPELMGDFQFTKTWLQSRSAISLQLNQDLVDAGERFTLLNETTDVKLLDNEEAQLALTEEMMQLAPNGAYLYSFSPAGFSAALVYGMNSIRLDVHDEDSPRYAMATLHLKDFEIFSGAMTHFGQNRQVMDNFQGWVNTVSSPVVTSGDTTLTVGMFNIINR